MISPGALFFLFGIVLVTEESFSRLDCDWFGGGVSTVSVSDSGCPVLYSIVSSDFAIEVYRATHVLTGHCPRSSQARTITHTYTVHVQSQ